MAKYRTKPKIVDAYQTTEEEWVYNIEFPELSPRGSLLFARSSRALSDGWAPTSQEHPGGELR